MEVELLFSSARMSAARRAAPFVLTAVAAIACVAEAEAAQPPSKPVVVQRAPVRAVAQPQFHAPPARTFTNVSRPARTTTTFTQQQNVNKNLHITNPNLHPSNPSVQLNNPNIQKFNNPNLQKLGNPSLQKPNPNFVQQKGVLPLQGIGALKPGPGKPNFSAVGLKPGPGGFQQIKPSFAAINFKNKFFPIFKGPKFIWVGGYKKFFVPVGILGVALIGGSYWYPDGYVAMDGPSCTGFTPDECQLHWRMVDFADGGGEPQCVQYCPQVGPPPAQIATLPPPPPLPPNGACQVTIFSDPNFAGTSAPTGDSQPALSQTGWRNEISSIQVQAGTWDFFSDENFGGEQMRLPSGPYPLLAPEWSKRIGSFMCVQPGPRA
jgi:hypothetical protein